MADAFDPDAYLKSTALPPVTVNSDNSKSAFDPDAYLGTEPPEPADHGLSERQKLSPIGKALSPITSYPETYKRMRNEALDQASEGIHQATHPDTSKGALESNTLWDIGAGAAKATAGAAGYVLSPVSAAYRSVMGQPLEDVTGIPREYTEFAAQLATPFIGLTGPKATPKAIPPKPTAPGGPFGVTLTEGEQTGDLAARQAEQAALRGQAGKPAQEHAEEFYDVQRPQQLEQAKSDVSKSLDPTGNQALVDNPAEAANMVQQSVQKEAARSKAGVKDLYDRAKALPGEIHADTFTDMPQNIKSDLSSRPDAVIIDDNTPVASRMIKYLDDQIGNLRIKNAASPYPNPPASQIAGVNLEGVEQWRKNLSRMRGDALAAYGTNPSDARAAQAIIKEFDDRIAGAVNSGAFTGDPRAVDLYNQARAAHSERMKLYGNDQVGRRIQAILGDAAHGKDPASLNDVANFMYSASGTSPNPLNIAVAKRLKTILGEDSPEWAAVRQGLFHRLVSTAEGVADRGYGTIANRLGEFLNGKGSDLAGVIFSPQQRNVLNQYADLHNQLKVPQVAANWPNTAAGIIPHIRAASDKILGAVGAYIGHHIMPGLAGEVAGWAAGQQTAKLFNKVEYARNLKQIAQQMPLLSHQMKVWQQASLAAARQASAANQRRVMIASTNLTAALSRFSHADPAFAKLLTQGPSGPGTGNANEQQRARGGKVKPTIPLPPLDDNDPDKLSDELIEAAKHFAAGGTPSFDERFQGTSQDNPSVDDMADQVSANAQKNAPDDSWKDREAQAGLALTQPEPTDSRSLEHRIADVAGKFADYDRQFTSDVLHAPQSIYEHGGKFAKKVIGENQDVQDISSPYDPLVIGSNPTKREQTWPERMVRSGAALPHDVATGEVPTYEQDPKTGEWHTSQQMIERAQDTAGMAGSGGLANAEEGAVLNSTPSLRPAMKYKGRIYKGQAGQEHPEVLPDELGADYYHRGMTGGDLSDYETGFLNHKGQFMDRAQALDYGIENGLVSPDAKKYGLLTSPILRSETDKPGAALAGLAERQHTPEMEIAKPAPTSNLPAPYQKLAEAKPELSKNIQDFVNLSKHFEGKYGDDWANKITPQDIDAIKTVPQFVDAVNKINSNAVEGVFNNALNQPVTRRSFLQNSALAARMIASSRKLGKMLESVAPEAVKKPVFNFDPGSITELSDSLSDIWNEARGEAVSEFLDTRPDVRKLVEEESLNPWEVVDKYPEINQRARDIYEDDRGNGSYSASQHALDIASEEYNKMHPEAEHETTDAEIEKHHEALRDWWEEAIRQAEEKASIPSTILRSETSEAGAPLAALEHAQPFYSAVEKTVESAPQQKMHGVQWANWLKNQSGVKPDELQYTGVDNWLREQKGPVTKQQVQDYIGQNKVQVSDVVKGEGTVKNIDLDRIDHQNLNDLFSDYAQTHDLDEDQVAGKFHEGNTQIRNDLKDHLKRLAEGDPSDQRLYKDIVGVEPTKYASYQLPGGENYREHLLTLPEKNETIPWSQQKGDRLRELDRKSANHDLNPVEQQEYNTLSAQATKRDSAPDQFKSSHWDEPNVLAHARTNERDVAGKPSLHLEELQSDWHQAGRKKGYKSDEFLPPGPRNFKDFLAEKGITDPAEVQRLWEDRSSPEGVKLHNAHLDEIEARNAVRSGRMGTVPDAPFKTSWPELAMKRMIQRAAAEGRDRISWTPGEAQAARYDLSKQVKKLEYDMQSGYVGGYDINGHRLTDHYGVNPDKLADIVGKEAADKLINNPTSKVGNRHSLEGVDLKVGGEGMKGFYDQMLPKMVEKLGKQYGVKVKEAALGNKSQFRVVETPGYGGGKIYDVKNENDHLMAGFKSRESAEDYIKEQDANDKRTKVKYFDIPEKMKQDVLSKGFPLFSDISHGAAINANHDNAERPKQEKPAERAAGGRVVASNIAIPTEKQRNAGNYSKDHLSVFGLRITVENAKGSKRSGIGKDGKPWESILPAHYGYLKGHEGADGDHVDVYLGPHPKAKSVYVVNQIDPDTKKFDETKAMLCFGSLHQALNTYKKGFSDGKGADRIGSIVQTSIEHFKHWLKHHNTKQPFTALN